MANAPFYLDRFFQALGETTRLRLLNLMSEQEICVCYLVEVLGAPQPTISRHLAYLRRAGIVAARRDGKWMHYRILMPQEAGAADILRNTLTLLRRQKPMQRDRERLERACCAPQRNLALADAPQPTPLSVLKECC